MNDISNENLEKILEAIKENYFPSENSKDWVNIYKTKLNSIDHDEPWLTLMAMYALFGDGAEQNLQVGIPALNAVLRDSGMQNLEFGRVISVKLERKLIEILSLRDHVKSELMKTGFKHLYPDRTSLLETKMDGNGSIEGNTNLDLYICGVDTKGNNVALYIEAKFLSDISHDTNYLIGRDQIIRNIDAMLDDNYDEIKCSFENKYFLLLTPKIFKEPIASKSYIAGLQPESSRLYGYKYREYKVAEYLKQRLPYRKKFLDEWKALANRIGWITFDDILQQAIKENTIDSVYKSDVVEFFKERNLL